VATSGLKRTHTRIASWTMDSVEGGVI